MCNIDTSQTSLHLLYLRISPDKFHFLKFIVEAYDNIAILSSVDNREGIVVLRYSEGHKEELFALLRSIAVKLTH
jgi:hypothetical protein